MKSRLIITTLGVLMSASPSVFAQASKILELKEPGLKERVAVAGVFELPKVNSRQIELTAAQKNHYSKTYKNYKFKDTSRYAAGIPLGITGIYAVDSTKTQDLIEWRFSPE